jgi:hypothetical protein
MRTSSLHSEVHVSELASDVAADKERSDQTSESIAGFKGKKIVPAQGGKRSAGRGDEASMAWTRGIVFGLQFMHMVHLAVGFTLGHAHARLHATPMRLHSRSGVCSRRATSTFGRSFAKPVLGRRRGRCSSCSLANMKGQMGPDAALRVFDKLIAEVS